MANSTHFQATATQRHPQPQPTFGLRDAIVVTAMLAVAGAAGVALSTHLELPDPIAAAIGLMVACLLLALHVIVMRSAQTAPPRPQVAKRRAPASAPADPLTTAVKSLAAERREQPAATAISAAAAPAREQVITQSVAALRSAATSLAAPDQAAPETPKDATAPPAAAERSALDHPSQLAALSGDAQKLTDIAEAIQGQRLETAVSVIPSLVETTVQHHEIIVRLKTRTGEMLIPDALLQGDRSSDLLPLLESLKISRAVRLAGALLAEGLSGALLSSHTADVLMNDRAMQTLLEPLVDGISTEGTPTAARYVVLSFPQSEVRRFTQEHWSRLADLADLGFRFALEQVGDLNADFELLRNVGVVFLRMDANVLAQGVASPAGPVQMAELPRLIAGLGLTLIVSHVDSATDLAQLTSIGVPFGQGGLFRAQERIALIADPEALAA